MDEYLNIQALYKLPFLRTESCIRNNVTHDLFDIITYTLHIHISKIFIRIQIKAVLLCYIIKNLSH